MQEFKKIKSTLITKPTTHAIAKIENDLKKDDPSIERALANIDEYSKDFYGQTEIIENCSADNPEDSTK